MLDLGTTAHTFSSDPWESAPPGVEGRWSAERAQHWYGEQPWIVGANFLPSSAINQLEMFQDESWDPKRIDRELGWAASIGMNTVRVYLHDLLWGLDNIWFLRRLDEFLGICARNGIRAMLVLFDSCWNPYPELGAQHRPTPGVHNSGWVQSPGKRALMDRREHARLQNYVEGVVGTFARDPRVLMWDVWNEPCNNGGGAYVRDHHPAARRMIAELLPKVFAWARSRGPMQPLTSGPWDNGSWAPDSRTLTPIQRIQLSESDVITFHNYEWTENFENRIEQLKAYGRPLICTEWLARGHGSTVDTHLPIAKAEGVGMINWGLVDGRSQTRFPWDSWHRPYTGSGPAPIWFHDVFHSSGKPYRQREVDLFRALTGRGTVKAAKKERVTSAT